jgi:septum formation protein
LTTRHSPLILASASPRRRSLLAEAGYDFQIDPAGIEEPEPTGPVDPAGYAVGLAWTKARTVASRHTSGVVLAADTVCFVEGTLLNKPQDRADAERMIRLQEGRDTDVWTALVLYRVDVDDWLGAVERSVVRFRLLSDAERVEFLDSGRWAGKAGAYGIQDEDPFVTLISGSWTNVVGLPMERLARLFEEFPTLGGRVPVR